MYRPKYSVNDDQALALDFIRKYPLGLLISHLNGRIETSFLPFLVAQESQDVFLYCHCAKGNPQSSLLNENVLISFQGPSAYISPTIYVDAGNVPTWNYTMVQASGIIEVISDPGQLKKYLNAAVHFFEDMNQTKWIYDLPNETQENLEEAIVGLKVKVNRVETKFKLSQNRSAVDYKAVVDFFKRSKKQSDQELYEWMLRSQM